MPFDGRNSPELWDDQLMVLERGRELIREGWTQRTLRSNDKESFCAIGAIHYQPLEDEEFTYTRHLIRALPYRWQLFGRIMVDSQESVEMFNDTPWRRKGRIIRLYNKAIKIRRKELNLTRKVGT